MVKAVLEKPTQQLTLPSRLGKAAKTFFYSMLTLVWQIAMSCLAQNRQNQWPIFLIKDVRWTRALLNLAMRLALFQVDLGSSKFYKSIPNCNIASSLWTVILFSCDCFYQTTFISCLRILGWHWNFFGSHIELYFLQTKFELANSDRTIFSRYWSNNHKFI